MYVVYEQETNKVVFKSAWWDICAEWVEDFKEDYGTLRILQVINEDIKLGY